MQADTDTIRKNIFIDIQSIDVFRIVCNNCTPMVTFYEGPDVDAPDVRTPDWLGAAVTHLLEKHSELFT